MMKIIQFLFIALLTLASCQFTEEITIAKNGSGIYNLSIDMSAMASAMKDMKPNDSIKKTQRVDSTFYMKDIMKVHKDSIAKLTTAEQQALKEIEALKMHMLMDEEKGEMRLDFSLDFKNISELQNIRKRIEKAQQLQKNKGKSEEDITNHNITYTYTKKRFSRNVNMKNLNTKEQEAYNLKMEETAMFLSGGSYKLIYHFPDKIKDVNYADAQFSKDHKTLIIEVDMDSLSKNPKLLDLEISF